MEQPAIQPVPPPEPPVQPGTVTLLVSDERARTLRTQAVVWGALIFAAGFGIGWLAGRSRA